MVDEMSRKFILKGIEAKAAKEAGQLPPHILKCCSYSCAASEMQGYSRGDHIALDLDSSDDEPVVNDDDVDNFDY